MERKILPAIVSFVICASLLLSACQSRSNGQFQTIQVAAADCSCGGEISKVQAVNEFQVQFTLCYSDLAFASKIANPVFPIQKKDALDSVSGSTGALSKNVIVTSPYFSVMYHC